jgi:L-methionine (R)-S-oxide reductase
LRQHFQSGDILKELDETKQLFDALIEKVKQIVAQSSENDKKLSAISKLLRDEVPYYDWVGFCLVDSSQKNELVLGPFSGEPTEHVRIAFGQGICGQAAKRQKTFVVQDVSKETNYLSCSAQVQSEIVVPIFKNGEIVRELDIDSYILSPFTENDRTFLEQVGEMVAGLL